MNMEVKSMNSTSLFMGFKEIMVVLLVGFCYIMQFDIAIGECTEACKGDKLVHKYSVKNVQNAHGDIFDCVDINKQPALDHPSLKDHVVQMESTSIPEGIGEVGSKFASSGNISFDGDCPVGSIPIMRRQGQSREFISNFDSSRSMGIQQLDVEINDSSYFAQIRMKSDKYYGTSANLVVYGLPQVAVNQFSSSAIWIVNDGGESLPSSRSNSIVVGWMVNSMLYGDNHTRLFTKWTSDDSENTGCYDLLCPGFVQVNPRVVLGSNIKPLSEYGGQQYALRILVYKTYRTCRVKPRTLVGGNQGSMEDPKTINMLCQRWLHNLHNTRHISQNYTWSPGHKIGGSSVWSCQYRVRVTQMMTTLAYNCVDKMDKIRMDIKSGDWWLVIGHEQIIVGYWPKSLFSTQMDYASQVYWGGEVRSPMNSWSAPMGSGHFPEEGLTRACAFYEVKLVSKESKYIRIAEDKTSYYEDYVYCYNLGRIMNMERGTQGFLFGGPGGCILMK